MFEISNGDISGKRSITIEITIDLETLRFKNLNFNMARYF